jgi:hypothetical protein
VLGRLLGGVLGAVDQGGATRLVEVARSRVAVHYWTGRDDVPVLCVCTPGAVLLPSSVVSPVLPSGTCEIRDGMLSSRAGRWRVARWWTPPRPCGLAVQDVGRPPRGVERLDGVAPYELVGLGPGLTPSGDDVVAGALVAAHAIADPRLGRWQDETRSTLRRRRTTAVSHGMLHHAVDGWAVPELADFVGAVCAGDPAPVTAALLRVGHSSGAALAAGAWHVLATSAADGGAA